MSSGSLWGKEWKENAEEDCPVCGKRELMDGGGEDSLTGRWTATACRGCATCRAYAGGVLRWYNHGDGFSVEVPWGAPLVMGEEAL